MIREAKRKAATLENFEEAMERTGGETGTQRKKTKTIGQGEGGQQNATKLHRLLDMFKVIFFLYIYFFCVFCCVDALTSYSFRVLTLFVEETRCTADQPLRGSVLFFQVVSFALTAS